MIENSNQNACNISSKMMEHIYVHVRNLEENIDQALLEHNNLSNNFQLLI